ncbi:MAG: ElyC/SanA/YdcF family protein [Minisyncoccia bacterium]
MKPKSFFIFIKWGTVLVFVVIFTINASIYAVSKPYIHDKMADLEEARVALIPGAAIFSSGKLSPVFEARVDGAIELYRAGKVSKILVSGDNSTVWYNEVSPVRDYLVREGVPADDIFLDHAGFDTYSTMYRARDIFKVDSVIISTQSFHLPRSVFIARALGLRAEGYSSDSGRVRFKNYIREIFANEKAMVNILLRREPRYLGEPIPIGGRPQEYP